MSRFFLVHATKLVHSSAEARALIARGGIDLRQAAITEEPIVLPADTSATDQSEEVKVLHYSADLLQLSVQSHRTSLLVMSENYYPGWMAWLDDAPAKIYNVDIAFRGIVIPAGTHWLRMVFRPVILPVSAAVSFATAGLIVFGLWYSYLRKRKMTGHDKATPAQP
jgi:Bacterial membrane protein YfhO